MFYSESKGEKERRKEWIGLSLDSSRYIFCNFFLIVKHFMLSHKLLLTDINVSISLQPSYYVKYRISIIVVIVIGICICMIIVANAHKLIGLFFT